MPFAIFAANLAFKRPTAQISTYTLGRKVPLSARLAVDGNRKTRIWARGSCTHTKLANNPWWRVDLGRTRRIGRVYVVNRGDCCGSRLNGFEIYVGMLGLYLCVLI